jgi:CheY-like chemotaxis protein
MPCYRLIFMDINMTGMDGVMTTQKIRELVGYEGVYIVAHTAITQD